MITAGCILLIAGLIVVLLSIVEPEHDADIIHCVCGLIVAGSGAALVVAAVL